MDESNGTCNQRFAGVGIPQTEAMRRAWRELLLTAPGLGGSLSNSAALKGRYSAAMETG